MFISCLLTLRVNPAVDVACFSTPLFIVYFTFCAMFDKELPVPSERESIISDTGLHGRQIFLAKSCLFRLSEFRSTS